MECFMNRRLFLRLCGAGIAGIGFTQLSQPIFASNQLKFGQKPNILLIMTDQQFAGAMSCVGNKDVKTPAMDSLAETGVVFEKTYCTYPLCTPSRSSVFTGLMPHQVGITENNQRVSKKYHQKMLAQLLSAAGYEPVYGGKWHIPSISVQTGDGFKKICGFSDWLLADKCIEYFKQEHKKPFFMVASFDNPHNICEYSRDEALPWGPVKKAPVEKCPNLPFNYAIPQYEPEAVDDLRMNHTHIYRASVYKPDDWRRYRHAYYRLVEKVDAEIGKILEGLKNSGLDKNTVVIFTSDHGDGMGAHQWNQKHVFYEESARVPLIVSFKGKTKPGHIDKDHLASNGIDIFQTVLDYASVTAPKDRIGLSLRPLAEGKNVSTWRDFVVSETKFDNNVHGRMIRTKKYKYIMYHRGKNREQLFDMENDPGELVDLTVEARYNDILQQHRDLLSQWIRQTNDRYFSHYAHPKAWPILPGQQYLQK